MKKFLAITLLSLVVILGAGVFGSAQALTIDPALGDSGWFTWDDGLGSTGDHLLFHSGDYAGFMVGDPYLEITVSTDSYIDEITVKDCCLVGDAFDLLVDGTVVPWTTSGFTGPGGLFEASALDVFLSAGTHTIDLIVTADCCGTGAAEWSVSGVTETETVPEPGTLLLLGAGFTGLAFVRRRIKG